jgi:protein-L-isoaspartate(D-aspartate) O-methyltransferase
MMDEKGFFTRQRMKMVAEQIVRRGIRDPRVIAAMRSVPRHCFIPDNLREAAYQDGPLPIGCGQTISQPYIVAIMTELLQLPTNLQNENPMRVLEIGTGSGYQAAVLAQMNCEVFTLERYPALANHAADVLQSLGYTRVHVITADGTLGWEDAAPYQGILVSAAAPTVPHVLLEQL